MNRFNELLLILTEVRYIIDSPDTDICWSRFNTIDEVIQFIDVHIEKTKQKDNAVFENLYSFFAPTGSLQEISMSSGWGNKYLELAERFDKLLL